MLIVIPYGTDYTSTMTGSVLKLVACENCAVEYVYRLERSATGTGTSLLFLDNQGASARATSRAEAELREKLEQGVDAVPCPACGWYQQHMLAKARKTHRSWMLTAGACVAIGAIPLAVLGVILNATEQGAPRVPWPVFLAGVIAVVLLGIGLMIAKFILASQYDPNSEDEEIRKQRGQELAILRADLERMMQAEQGPPATEGNA